MYTPACIRPVEPVSARLNRPGARGRYWAAQRRPGEQRARRGGAVGGRWGASRRPLPCPL
eukprot:scaffold86229_cov72-Phaeocystis_antarctica.AAC.2